MFDGSVALNILFIVFYCFNLNLYVYRVVFRNVGNLIGQCGVGRASYHAFLTRSLLPRRKS